MWGGWSLQVVHQLALRPTLFDECGLLKKMRNVHNPLARPSRGERCRLRAGTIVKSSRIARTVMRPTYGEAESDCETRSEDAAASTSRNKSHSVPTSARLQS